VIEGSGFVINDVRRIGHQVYEPLADYYARNREDLREKILQKYPAFLENVLHRSLAKMGEVSRKEIIDYVIIKAHTKVD
jgi:hypothetical protein